MTRRFEDDAGLVQVVFKLPKEAGATSAAVAGDFNDWSVDRHEMQPQSDGGFSTTLMLAAGRTYAYRYWVNGDTWENDWAADGYVPNEFGGENSMIDLRTTSRHETRSTDGEEPPEVGAPISSDVDDDSAERPPD